MRTASRLLIIFLALGCSSCQFSDEQPSSILVIAIDSLGFQDVNCQDDPVESENTGFQTLCRESVRFTHAYSPSPMAQSALASLLTGLYADTHGVWHNGSHFVSAKLETVAEHALKNGYKTGFFSGGAPIWSKSGLRQGFEGFDDNINVQLGRLYRPVEKNFDLFLHWLDDTGKTRPFFAVTYLPDLQMENVSTVADSGEVRKKSFEGQLLEIDESLENLIRQMKKRKIWNQTMVILTGLSGKTDPNFRGLLKPYNMYAENTQVTLLIKPQRINPERGTSWKIDRNVSLADVGHTLYQWLGGTAPNLPKQKIHPQGINDAILTPEVHWSDEQLILIGSGWPAWRMWGEAQVSVRRGHHLTLLSEPLVTYNTLTDRMENTPQPNFDSTLISALAGASNPQSILNPRPWQSIPREMFQKLVLAREIWSREELGPELQSQLMRLAENKDDQVLGWMSYWAVRMGNWLWLEQIAVLANNKIWHFIAKRALGQNASLPDNGCLALYGLSRLDIKINAPRVCDDRAFVALLLWMSLTDANSESARYREEFLREYETRLTDESIAFIDFVNFHAWDVPAKLLWGPSSYDLILYLPENKSYLNIVKRRLSAKN
ncbi:MAG: sulfatase-like hydrolase/transferase [Pseudomonadota bacterium]|nr:sulfatase-like hydrolase/transferase [Pseudomonadota bacterium]